MTTISPRALYRSADETLTPTILRKNEYVYNWSQQTIDDIADWCTQYWISWTDRTQINFHQKLMRFPWFPEVFYRKWNYALLQEPLLAIVWPRKPSVYIHDVMHELFATVSNYKIVTLSGGADGVDMMAHSLSLERAIPTIVILGWGFRWYQSTRERSFFEQVVKQWWLIISERKLDQSPTKYTFPQRNRLVAWCADAVFIPWAAQWSWSLITVDFALKFGIPVWTVPGSIFEITSAWTNTYLFEKKIRAWCCVEDFLKEYFGEKISKKQWLMWLTDYEKRIVDLLKTGPMSVVQLTHAVWLTVWDMLIHLSCLEMRGAIVVKHPEVYALAQK